MSGSIETKTRRGPRWAPGRVPRASTRGTAAVRRAIATEAGAALGKVTPDLEIQGRRVRVDPQWRDLIEHWIGRWTERYPELSRVHVTLAHGRHHRHGVEEVAALATIPGATLRVAKLGEQVADALHAALQALDRELRDAHRQRRRSRVFPLGGRRGPDRGRTA